MNAKLKAWLADFTDSWNALVEQGNRSGVAVVVICSLAVVAVAVSFGPLVLIAWAVYRVSRWVYDKQRES